MQNNKLRSAIRASIAITIFGTSMQVGAFSLNTDTVDASLYGYARLNASYDINEDISSSARTGDFGKLGGADEDVEGHFGADAYQSRIGVKVKTQEGLEITVEGDFRGSGGGSLRLRHAFAEYKGVLMGQTWSNYMSFYGITPSLDFDGIPGLSGLQGRVAQARYTSGNFSVALEETMTSVVDSTDMRQGLPTLTARFEKSVGNLSYSVAGLGHQVTVDDGATDESTFGFAGYLAANFAVTDAITLHGTINYSDGANLYLYRSGTNFGGEDAYLSGGNLHTIEGYAGTVGASIDVGKGRSVNIAYGMATLDWDDAENDLGTAVIGEKTETSQRASINYTWTPVDNVMMGIEYAYHQRETVANDNADANRLLFAAQYSF